MQPFTWIAERIGAFLDWLCRQRQAGADRAASERDRRLQPVQAALDSITLAMQKVEYDWRSGHDRSRDEAEDAAIATQALAHQIADEEARDHVLGWRSAFDAAPKGWKRGDTREAEEVRVAHRAAAASLGRVLRDG